jgi:hypothetical protein
MCNNGGRRSLLVPKKGRFFHSIALGISQALGTNLTSDFNEYMIIDYIYAFIYDFL